VRFATARPRHRLLAVAVAWVAVLSAIVLGLAGSGRELRAEVSTEGLARAVAAQRQLVLDRPADATAHEDLGSLLTLTGDLAGAEEAYRAAIAIDPESASAHFQLGSILERRGDERKALAEYRRAIKLDDAYAWAHYEAGSIWARWGIDSLARKSYARALALDPSLGDPAVNPHILDNKLATTAMILAYRKYQPEVSAPRTFHEPARIAALILDQPPIGDRVAEEETAPAAIEEPGGYARLKEGAEPRMDDPDGIEVEGETEARVLTPGDLDTTSNSGQVVGGAVVGVRGGGEAAADRAKARAAARQAASRSGATEPPTGSPISLNPMFQNPSAGGGGTTFTPSAESTGRLEVRLEEIAG
jgi:tetratricopeptide (TPR) repeat protein